VIPKEAREKIGIKPGTKVVVEVVNDHIEIYPLPDNPVKYFHGIFRKGASLTEALLKERREDVKRERKKASRFIRSSGLPEKLSGCDFQQGSMDTSSSYPPGGIWTWVIFLTFSLPQKVHFTGLSASSTTSSKESLQSSHL